MPRYAANLTLLYTELPFLERYGAAAADGFAGVECLFPYAWPAAEVAARLRSNGLRQVLFNAPPGGLQAGASEQAWAEGRRGSACLPGQEAEFRQGVLQALEYAQHIDCQRIHLMAGLAPAGAEPERLLATYVENLRWAAAQAQACGRTVLIEPINHRDMPGYYLRTQAQAHAVLDAVASPALQVQMDLYHCQITEGDVASKLRQYLPGGRVGHLQIAGVPERHEPDSGELNYAYLLALLDQLSAQCGWDGWVGCEYRPRRGAVAQGTSAGLGWRAALAASAGEGV